MPKSKLEKCEKACAVFEKKYGTSDFFRSSLAAIVQILADKHIATPEEFQDQLMKTIKERGEQIEEAKLNAYPEPFRSQIKKARKKTKT